MSAQACSRVWRKVTGGRRALSLLGGAVLVYVVLFWRLGDATFWDPDEAHYAQTTRELIASGEWLAPTYNQELFFDKPIFFHWLQSLPMRIVGPTEGAARVAGAVALLLLVGVTWWVGCRLDGSPVGVAAALLLACNPGVFGLARYAILDAPFTFFLFSGVSLLAVSAITSRPRLQYGGYVLLGCATCIKGPLAMALCGLTLAMAALASPTARRLLLGLHWIRGVLIVAAIAAPWFALMVSRFGNAFIDGYFLKENLTLFARPLYANQPGWWFYPEILATGFLPWTGLVLGRAYDHIRSAVARQPGADVVDAMLWSWVLAILGFFSASQFKLDHYVFPVAPAVCLLAARAWRDSHVGQTSTRTSGVRLGARLIGPILVLAGLAIGVLAMVQLDLPRAFLLVPALITLCGALAASRYGRSQTVEVGPPRLAIAALGVLYVGALLFVIPRLEQGKVVPGLARWVSARATATDRVATFRLNRWNPAYRFYVARHVETLESDEDARRFFSDQSSYYCVMIRPQYEALRRAGVPLRVSYSREGIWATSGKALWRRRGEPTDFVVTTRDP
jgi:4-amino-4-deoxy-L-arabinose transferase-like glycosyltransferase